MSTCGSPARAHYFRDQASGSYRNGSARGRQQKRAANFPEEGAPFRPQDLFGVPPQAPGEAPTVAAPPIRSRTGATHKERHDARGRDSDEPRANGEVSNAVLEASSKVSRPVTAFVELPHGSKQFRTHLECLPDEFLTRLGIAAHALRSLSWFKSLSIRSLVLARGLAGRVL
jgi:hypothetical protein